MTNIVMGRHAKNLLFSFVSDLSTTSIRNADYICSMQSVLILLLFSVCTQDQRICITTKFKTLGNTTKPLFLKNLRTVWNRFGTCLSCGKRKYDETNTLLVDDSPDKALCNPVSSQTLTTMHMYSLSAISHFSKHLTLVIMVQPHTGIFPFPYQYTDREDSALGESFIFLNTAVSKFCNIKLKELMEIHIIPLHYLENRA